MEGVLLLGTRSRSRPPPWRQPPPPRAVAAPVLASATVEAHGGAHTLGTVEEAVRRAAPFRREPLLGQRDGAPATANGSPAMLPSIESQPLDLGKVLGDTLLRVLDERRAVETEALAAASASG